MEPSRVWGASCGGKSVLGYLIPTPTAAQTKACGKAEPPVATEGSGRTLPLPF
ncbi:MULTISPECIES: hypothetical protein [unclassified Pseudovibrio]|uniref:hypothetical protein n=1 Tax=unclassified Pseudovibrio TaxID=2627060 RepID=UPI00187CF618|nr:MULTISPECIES: hypothetical protein [unclassified Pseudovibrio]